MEAVDLGALFFFSTHRVEWLNTLNLAITTLGNFQVMAPVAALMALVLWRLRDGRTAGLFAIAVVATYLLCLTTQLVVARPRPDVLEQILAIPNVPSFPSGHATNSMLIYGLFGLLLTRPWQSSRSRLTVRVGLFVLAGLIGFTRLYLGVHFVSDVLGGWLLAVGILLCAYGLDRAPLEKNLAPV